jgi:hypothetical protein
MNKDKQKTLSSAINRAIFMPPGSASQDRSKEPCSPGGIYFLWGLYE